MRAERPAYEGRLGHYIGPHSDKTEQLVPGAPIVTLSFGEERVFRLRPIEGKGYRDFRADDGTVFVMPDETNRAWHHEVPRFARYRGQRVSVTLRAFIDDALSRPDAATAHPGIG